MSSPVELNKQTSNDTERGLDANVLKIALVLVLGTIMAILDMTVVNVALSTFQREFDTSYAIAAWTMTGYTLALAAVIPLAGWAADRFGARRLYLFALSLFILGSVLCSLAWNIESLIAFRVVQGCGGGMILPLGMTILTRAAGPDRIGRVMAILGIPMLLGPICGPILGGWLIGSASWHWIFLINVPVGLLAIVAGAVVLPRDGASTREPFDFLGMALASPGLGLLLFGFSSIPQAGTVVSARVLVPIGIGILLLIGFVVHAIRATHPLIDLSLFRNRQLLLAALIMLLFGAAFFGCTLLMPTYYLQLRGESTLRTGVLLIPQGIGAMLAMPIAGKLADRIGAGRIIVVGIVLIAIAMASFTRIGWDTPYAQIIAGQLVMGAGLGCTMMPTMGAALKMLTNEQTARGSTLMNIVNQVAGSIGTATISITLTKLIQQHELASAVIAARLSQDAAPARGLRSEQVESGLRQAGEAFGHTYLVGLGLIAVALVPAVLLARRSAAYHEL
ncbi:DHA2 family efflux MFS transporter permease subunit [Nocardia sp. NPDC005366]|uniref:DHA2 family efflux MFS transporter permease subunit n=1 Tax=Nocardia sp. NPDC005366 TaxID=3156878 RepID=UPI0033B8D94D